MRDAAAGDPATKDQDVLAQAREQYSTGLSSWSAARQLALDSLRFKSGEQWTQDATQAREGRPQLTLNQIPAFVRQVVNDARMNKPSIKVRPVDSGADVQTANVINGIFRHIEAISHADVAYDWAIDNAASCGMGFIAVDFDYANDDAFDMDIFIREVQNPFTVVWDPASTRSDSSDWGWAFITEEFTQDAFKARWPGAQSVPWEGDDKDNQWITEDMVRVAKYWTRTPTERTALLLENGEIVDAALFAEAIGAVGPDALPGVVRQRVVNTFKLTHRIINGAEVLSETAWPGTRIPIAPCWGEEQNIEGKRLFLPMFYHGMDAQRMLNYWQSAATEMVALTPKVPWIGRTGAFDTEAAKWATANRVNHSYLQYDGAEAPQRPAPANMPAAELAMTAQTSELLRKIIGINSSGMGERSNEIAGVAINARKVESDVSTYHLIDNLSRSIRNVAEIVLGMLPEVYPAGRVARVLGEDGTAQIMPIPALDRGNYDVVCEAGPGFTTRRQEAAAQMMQMVQALPQFGEVAGDLLAKNLDWPGAEEISARLRAMIPPHILNPGTAPPQPPPDPAMVKAQAAVQEAKARFELDRQKAVADATLEREKLTAKLQMERESGLVEARQKTQVELERMNREHALKIEQMNREYELRLQELQAEADLSLIKMQTDAVTSANVNIARPE